MKKSKKLIQFVVSLVVMAALGWYMLSDIDIPQLIAAFSNVDYFWVAATLPVSLLSHFLRAVRWRTILHPAAPHTKLRNAFSAVMVGYFINNILPRVGEVARPYLFAKRENLRVTTVLATVVIERVVDVATLGLITAGTFLMFHEELAQTIPQATPFRLAVLFVVPVVALVSLLLMMKNKSLTDGLVQKTIGRYSTAFAEKAIHLADGFRDGLSVIASPGRYRRVIAESLAIWGLYGVPIWMTFYAFGFQSTVNLNIVDALVLLVVTSVAITIAPTPGGFLVYHTFASKSMVLLYGIPQEEALAWATVAHMAGYACIMIFGLGFFAYEHSRGFTLSSVDQAEDTLAVSENG